LRSFFIDPSFPWRGEPSQGARASRPDSRLRENDCQSL
jgi:hypothetical protein